MSRFSAWAAHGSSGLVCHDRKRVGKAAEIGAMLFCQSGIVQCLLAIALLCCWCFAC